MGVQLPHRAPNFQRSRRATGRLNGVLTRTKVGSNPTETSNFGKPTWRSAPKLVRKATETRASCTTRDQTFSEGCWSSTHDGRLRTDKPQWDSVTAFQFLIACWLELADALDSKSSPFGGTGSSPVRATNITRRIKTRKRPPNCSGVIREPDEYVNRPDGYSKFDAARKSYMACLSRPR